MKPTLRTLTPIVTALVMTSGPANAQAATAQWTCGQASWWNAGCWSLGRVPGAADEARIGMAGLRQSVDVDGSGGDWVLDRLTMGGFNDYVTLQQTGGTLRMREQSIQQFGIHILRGTGLHIVDDLVLGSSGSYSQSGGALFATRAVVGESASMYVGGGQTLVQTLTLGGDFGIGGLGGAFTVGATGSLDTFELQVVGGFFAQSSRHDARRVTIGGDRSVRSLYLLHRGATLSSQDVRIGGVGDTQFDHLGTHTTQSLRIGTFDGAGRYELEGELHAASFTVGGWGAGTFVHRVGGQHFAAAASVQAQGRYELGGGLFQAPLLTESGGLLVQTGGELRGSLTNAGRAELSGGLMNGDLVNTVSGELVLSNDYRVTGGALRNLGAIVLRSSVQLDGMGLDNEGAFTLAGGRLGGGGALVNRAWTGGWGRIEGIGGTFTNHGTFAQGAGDLVLANTGGHLNYGHWALAAGRKTTVDVGWTNYGAVDLGQGHVAGNGAFINAEGGVLHGSGRISAPFGNVGMFAPGPGVTIVDGEFASSGHITLGGPASQLRGATIVNTGIVNGVGTVANPIDNRVGGRIEAYGGPLVLTGSVTNAGTLSALSGGVLRLQGGLAANSGTLALDGGRIELGTSGLVNAGRVTAGAGTSQLVGPFVNAAGSRVLVTGGGALSFEGRVELEAGSTVDVREHSAAIFFGDVTVREGALLAGPGTLYFEGGLAIGASPGTATMSGSTTFGAGAVFVAELAGATSFDHYATSDILTLGGTLRLVSLDGFVAGIGDRFDLLDWGVLEGSFTAIDTSGFAIQSGSVLDTSSLYVDGSIAVVAVPEPATVWLWAAGTLIGAIRRRMAPR